MKTDHHSTVVVLPPLAQVVLGSAPRVLSHRLWYIYCVDIGVFPFVCFVFSPLFPSSLLFYQLYSQFFMHSLNAPPSLAIFFIFPFPFSLCLNVLECCCPLINVLDFAYPHLPLCLSLFLSLRRRRGLLFLIKEPAPELTQHTTKPHHHHHPCEQINNSARCPMHHHA